MVGMCVASLLFAATRRHVSLEACTCECRYVLVHVAFLSLSLSLSRLLVRDLLLNDLDTPSVLRCTPRDKRWCHRSCSCCGGVVLYACFRHRDERVCSCFLFSPRVFVWRAFCPAVSCRCCLRGYHPCTRLRLSPLVCVMLAFVRVDDLGPIGLAHVTIKPSSPQLVL